MIYRIPEKISDTALWPRLVTYFDRLPSQNEERLGSLGKKASKLVDKDVFDFIRLFYPYAHSDAVHTGFNEDLLVLIPRNRQRIQKQFGRRGSLDLGDIVSL